MEWLCWDASLAYFVTIANNLLKLVSAHFLQTLFVAKARDQFSATSTSDLMTTPIPIVLDFGNSSI